MANLNPLEIKQNHSCSFDSRDHGESLLGTAPYVKYWLLLEYPKPFGGKAFKDSEISAPVKQHLNEFTLSEPQSKLLLIKKHSKKKASGIVFYFGITGTEPKMLKFNLNDYEELLKIKLNQLVSDPSAHEHQTTNEKMFLVCTNGKRDKCCAEYGMEVFRELKQNNKINVWQSSHVGQHRFAANIIAFPEGIYYGRVDIGNVTSIANSHLSNNLYLENLRGQSKYPSPVQAAEGFLRKNIDINNISKLILINYDEIDEGKWKVNFSENSTVHEVNISIHNLGKSIYASCDADKLIELSEFRLDGHKTH